MDENRRAAFLSGMAVALGGTALLGVVLIIRHLLNQKALALAAPAPSVMWMPPWPERDLYDPYRRTAGIPVSAVTPPRLFPTRAALQLQDTTMRTLNLPDITTTTEAYRLATGVGGPMEAVVRCIGPAGAFVVLSYDPAVFYSLTSLTAPTGDVLIVGTGEVQRVPLRPGEVLWGKGAAVGAVPTAVSVSCGPPAEIPT